MMRDGEVVPVATQHMSEVIFNLCGQSWFNNCNGLISCSSTAKMGFILSCYGIDLTLTLTVHGIQGHTRRCMIKWSVDYHSWKELSIQCRHIAMQLQNVILFLPNYEAPYSIMAKASRLQNKFDQMKTSCPGNVVSKDHALIGQKKMRISLVILSTICLVTRTSLASGGCSLTSGHNLRAALMTSRIFDTKVSSLSFGTPAVHCGVNRKNPRN